MSRSLKQGGSLAVPPESDTYAVGASPAALRPWFAALAKRDWQKASAAFVGTSMTEGGPVQSGGYGITATNRRWTDRLAVNLRNRFPLAAPVTGSTGYTPAFYQTFNAGGTAEAGHVRPFNVTVSSTALLAAGFGFGNRSLELTATTDWIEFSFTGTGVDVFFSSRTVTSSTATFTVDGGTGQTLTVPTATNTAGVQQVRGLTAGTHTIRVIGATGQVDVAGIYPYNGDESKGIHVIEAGKGSAKAVDVNGTGPYKSFATVQPALVGFEFGYNEFFAPSTLATFQSTFQTLVTNALAPITTPPTVLFIKWAEPYDATPAPDSYAAYMAVVDAIAANTPNSLVIDFSKRFPANSAANTLGYWHGDRVHHSDIGAGVVADILTTALIPR